MKTREGKRGRSHPLLGAAAVSPEPSCPQDGCSGREPAGEGDAAPRNNLAPVQQVGIECE